MPVVILSQEQAFPSITGEKKIIPTALMIGNYKEENQILNDMTTGCDQGWAIVFLYPSPLINALEFENVTVKKISFQAPKGIK